MRITNKQQELLILGFLLLIAAVLRFWNFTGMSLFNDELSALNRTRVGSFDELMLNSVRIDGHPAGVQIFLYYWTKIFGTTEAALRTPFIICSLFSIVTVYLLGKKWFGAMCGLLCAASLACLEFPLYYSILARPYSPGLLFSLCAAYFWTIVLFDPVRGKKIPYLAGLILFASLCMYTHYFSFLFALIVGASGLFFLRKENFARYLICLLITGLLYVPHIPVFLHQLSLGGLGWLGPPDKTFLLDFTVHTFNHSLLLMSAAGIILLVSLFFRYRQAGFGKFRLLCLIWFVLPFIIGYLKSVYSQPMLQFSILIFSFPFLLLFIFSFVPDDIANYKKLLLVFVWTALCLYSTLHERQFFKVKHHGEFRQLAVNTAEWGRIYGDSNITRLANVNHPFYIHYYLDRLNPKLAFAQYRNDGGTDTDTLRSIIDRSSTEYVIYAWSGKGDPPVNLEIVRSKYPEIIIREEYPNSGIVLLRRKH